MGSQNPKIEALHTQRIADNKLTPFRVGDTVNVHYKVAEGEKERIQVFQGVVIKRHRAGARSTFTVRKVSFGVGVERVFLLHSPRVDASATGPRASWPGLWKRAARNRCDG